MKVTEEQIKEIGFAITTDIFNEAYNTETVKVEISKAKLFTLGQEGYYEHDGWLFMVDSEKLYGNEAETFMITLLDDGTPVNMASILGDDKPRTIYVIKGTDGKYKSLSKEDYFKHHKFDFSKKEFVKKNFNF